MNAEELAVVTRWMAAGLDNELIGANWHWREKNNGRPQPMETCAETGRKLREEVENERAKN